MDIEFPEPLQQVDRTWLLWRGRKLVYFGGCDYLRLSSQPQVLRAAARAITRFGLNVAASRTTTGNHRLYEELETSARWFFGSQRAILVSNGYLANLVAAQGMTGAFEHIFIDERAHSSLVDATEFLRCPQTRFAHRNPADLRRKIQTRGLKGRFVIMTDGMFAYDGSIAPLAQYRAVAGRRVVLWIDDAHGAGILGKQGRGAVEAAGLDRCNLIQTVTFSKAFGTYGGAILSERAFAERIISGSSVLAGNTPVPLPLASAALAALKLCRHKPILRRNLWRNVRRFWEEIGRSPDRISPIVSVAASKPKFMKELLLEEGIFPSLIRYGAAPVGEFFRFAISSEHSADQIKRLARALTASRTQEKRGELLILGLDL